MTAAATFSLDLPVALSSKHHNAAQDVDVGILTNIYEEDINIVVWQRELPQNLCDVVTAFLAENSAFKTILMVTPDNVLTSLSQSVSDSYHALREDIVKLVNRFCYLLVLEQVKLSLSVVNQTMCPKFHVDRVACRLITTYQGEATEWLPHSVVDRTKLGVGSKGLPDHESGLYLHSEDIQQLTCGDVALLKGELWQDNTRAGLVHRSPGLAFGERRLLLTLDFAN